MPKTKTIYLNESATDAYFELKEELEDEAGVSLNPSQIIIKAKKKILNGSLKGDK